MGFVVVYGMHWKSRFYHPRQSLGRLKDMLKPEVQKKQISLTCKGYKTHGAIFIPLSTNCSNLTWLTFHSLTESQALLELLQSLLLLLLLLLLLWLLWLLWWLLTKHVVSGSTILWKKCWSETHLQVYLANIDIVANMHHIQISICIHPVQLQYLNILN